MNRYMTSIGHAFTVAIREWEWLEHNPVRPVRKLREARGRARFLSDEERECLLAACRTTSDRRLYPLVVLAISTGARRGELLRLRWPHIDLEWQVAVLHETKNGQRRALPLHGRAWEVIGELKRVRHFDTDLIFAGRDGRALFPRRPWERALQLARVDDFRFHDLRHSAASYLAMNGATLVEIAEILGHQTLEMVRRYSHFSEQHTSRVIERMNRRIFG